MDLKTFIELLSSLGIRATNNQIENLLAYHKLLEQWNKKINLVSRQLKDKIWEEIYYDSLIPNRFNLIPQNSRCIDLGSGAGIPGIIISLFLPLKEMWLVEAQKKKILFLNLVKQTISLEKIKIFF